MMRDGAIEVSLGVHGGHLFLGSDLGHGLVNGSNIDISNFHPLVRGDLQLLGYDLGRSLDGQRLLRRVLALDGASAGR